MGVKTKYEAKDGTQFEDRKDAEEHDEELFVAWLESQPTIAALAFLNELDDSETVDYGGTQYRNFRDQLKSYWERKV